MSEQAGATGAQRGAAERSPNRSAGAAGAQRGAAERQALWLLVAALALGGCTIGRDYVGSTLRADPVSVLTPGKTTLTEVMEIFGAPDKIQRRRRGEILSYRFVRGNESTLHLEEPVITGITFFVYTKRQLKADRLTLFFDEAGALTAFGFTGGVEELEPL